MLMSDVEASTIWVDSSWLMAAMAFNCVNFSRTATSLACGAWLCGLHFLSVCEPFKKIVLDRALQKVSAFHMQLNVGVGYIPNSRGHLFVCFL